MDFFNGRASEHPRRENGWKSRAKLLKKETALATARRTRLAGATGAGNGGRAIGPPTRLCTRLETPTRHRLFFFFLFSNKSNFPILLVGATMLPWSVFAQLRFVLFIVFECATIRSRLILSDINNGSPDVLFCRVRMQIVLKTSDCYEKPPRQQLARRKPCFGVIHC